MYIYIYLDELQIYSMVNLSMCINYILYDIVQYRAILFIYPRVMNKSGQ